ncbi:MAG: class I SAM-dependent methyltransferase [Planctomycetes bacterium]|nr:class I SAM-dependent methyltransferase [Planctomycetota bacterium]
MDPRIVANYRSPEGAARYEVLYRGRLHKRISDRVERRLIQRVFDRIGPQGRILDLPCGAGRLFPELARHSAWVVEADFSYPMLGRCRRNTEAVGYVNGSALALPFRDGSFDAVFSARLAHHLPDSLERDRYIHEVARVSRRWVVMTFFDEFSLKNVVRVLRRPFNRKRPKVAISTTGLHAVAAAAGLELLESHPLSLLFSGHRYALLRKVDARDP